jgi:hypothetical protein
MDETIPIPETTTRLMPLSIYLNRLNATKAADRLTYGTADAKVGRLVDGLAVGFQPAVADPEHQLGLHHALQIDPVFNQLDVRAAPCRRTSPRRRRVRAAAFAADPAQEEPEQLPERVKAEAPGHHGIALEVAGEEPEVRPDRELRADMTLSVIASVLENFRDAIKHEHRRQRQLGIALDRTVRLARRPSRSSYSKCV